MENCLAAAALNGVDRRALQRTARLGREVLERARTRAADWRPRELPRSSVGGASRERPAAGPQRLLPGQREERQPTLSASFRTMAAFMDYTSSQCGKYYSSVLEEGGAAHVSRYHRGKSTVHLCWDMGNGQKKETSLDLGGISQASECALAASQPAENISKDLYIEVYPGTYSVTVGTSDLTRTQVVAVDSGQSVDLVFPI
ncbi:A-kinase-interacting protein 1 isoform X2 [Canis lupus baileyi]|uniref:A-kinase interacting protein 1 n=3 Tax=Canis lupus TaxID=9612 RepID=A0A8C0QIH3_CANLF|nr:A-kinase-interacting protein 1 isoform X2 [Canis lupus familiaris]XP_025315206.1 A-kinase-interacting protein 1 isoform X2 [Canis lupus dingo]XP_038286390.1 A-kinase-interacting protein 1 isoform X2 [Canis lupus familiaris]XP_038424928.1 A-kinase-interacting protein 1 isoform X2 [Canis lupus familiaris]XP_048954728.1 A-kinase-interacting protein 1 isoform X2 [Canis lupus dingo]|eukprot:XP_022263530.1 A-kinase-interacting protein 1 isoform X2 [Canis lupus familiaris]